MLSQMIHYAQRHDDGSVHVTNAVGGMFGQHHAHTAEGFEAWKPAGEVEWLEGCGPCDCGQEPRGPRPAPPPDPWAGALVCADKRYLTPWGAVYQLRPRTKDGKPAALNVLCSFRLEHGTEERDGHRWRRATATRVADGESGGCYLTDRAVEVLRAADLISE